jgi:hypothetical protein
MRSGIAGRRATGVSNIDEPVLHKRLTGNLEANSLRFSARPADAMVSPVVFAPRGRLYRNLDRGALRLAAATIDEVFSGRFVAVGDGSRR